MKTRNSELGTRNKKIIIGLTGLIASGKTETAKVFRKAGFKVIDVDSFAHGLYKKGAPLHKILVKKYGRGILAPGGHINRRKLGQIVFSDRKHYGAFCRLVFPRLNAALKFKIQNSKFKVVVLDMAVLFESGFHRHCDAIIFVRAPEQQIQERLKARKHASVKKALKFQKFYGINKKIAKSTYILYNNKNKAALKGAAGKLILKIKDKYVRN